MNYAIVFKNGDVKRLISIDGFQLTEYYISFFTKNKEKVSSYPRDDIASVVFYP